jgi:hypothetical protein
MYNNLAGHAARVMSQEVGRAAVLPERLMAEEAGLSRRSRSRRRRWRTR